MVFGLLYGHSGLGLGFPCCITKFKVFWRKERYTKFCRKVNVQVT